MIGISSVRFIFTDVTVASSRQLFVSVQLKPTGKHHIYLAVVVLVIAVIHGTIT